MGRYGAPSQLTGIDAQRAMLDELMGMNRNQDNPDAEVHEYGDRRVCKHFLLGCCPHDVFRQTKIDLGACEKIHKDELKEQFDAAVDKGERGALADQGDYERALEGTLREFIQEADRKIQRGIRRVEGEGGSGSRAVLISGPEAIAGLHNSNGAAGAGAGAAEEESKPPALPAPPAPVPVVDISTHPEVVQLQAEAEAAAAAAEAAKGEGKEEEAKQLLEKADGIKKKRAELQGNLLAEAVAKGALAPPPPPAPPAPAVAAPAKEMMGGGGGPLQGQKLRVCAACGAFLSITDSEQRMMDHFEGKLHVGYVQLRGKLKELEDKRWKNRGGGSRGGSSRDRRRSRSRSRERSSRRRSRSRSGSRSRRVGRSRSRSGSRSRASSSRRRSRSRSGSRSRSRRR